MDGSSRVPRPSITKNTIIQSMAYQLKRRNPAALVHQPRVLVQSCIQSPEPSGLADDVGEPNDGFDIPEVSWCVACPMSNIRCSTMSDNLVYDAEPTRVPGRRAGSQEGFHVHPASCPGLRYTKTVAIVVDEGGEPSPKSRYKCFIPLVAVYDAAVRPS